MDVQTLTLIILLGTLNGRLVTRFYLGNLNNGINTAGILGNIPANTFQYKVWVKVKFTPEQATKTQCGRYSSTLSLTLALDGGPMPRPGCFTPGKETQYPLYRRLGGPQGRSGQVRKISPQPGFNPWTIQPVASPYTN